MSRGPSKLLPACCCLIVDKHLNILGVTNRKFGGWCLPGGKMSQLEHSLWLPRNTAVRETWEETDVILNEHEMMLLGIAPSNVEPEREVRVYYAMSASGTPRAKEPGTDVGWIAFQDLQNDPIFGGFYSRMFPHGHGQKPTIWRY